MNPQQVAAIFKALGDENRIQILKMLLTGEKMCLQTVGQAEYYTAHTVSPYEDPL